MQELEYKLIPIKDIDEDPEQPRKFFDPVKLEELSNSLTEHGMLEPVIVRPVKSGKNTRFMLVVGERRLRAARLAKMDAVPAMVKKYSDIEAREVQITENLQRENVNPMEEAVAFKALTKKGVYTVDRLAARLGKRTEYIRQRLRLCELTLLWQQLVYVGKLRITDANQLCRFGPDQQGQFYTQYVPKDWEKMPEGWVLPPMQLMEKTKNLDEAPFKTEDPTLNPKMGPCNSCMYNTFVSQLPFEGQTGPRICSNPACYHIKEQNNHQQKLAEAVKNNAVFVAGYTYSPAGKEQLKQAEATGQPILQEGDYEILEEPKLLNKEKYVKQHGVKLLPKTEAEVEALYDAYQQQVATEQAEYNFKKQHAQKAFVVAADTGIPKGEYVEVYVHQPEPEAIAREQEITAQIAKLQQQKTKEIAAANTAFLKDLAKALQTADAYWNCEKPLEIKDYLALLQLLTDIEETYDQHLQAEMRMEWGNPQVKTEDMLTSILSTSRTSFVHKWLRRYILSKITEFDITDAGGLSLRLLAERYIPLKLADLQKLYKAKQQEIIAATNDRIAALQQTEIPMEDDEPMFTEEEVDKIVNGVKKAFEQLSEA